MAQLAVYAATVLCLWLTTAISRRQYLGKTLTAGRFALTLSVGMSLTVLVMCFLGLTVAGKVELDGGLIALGIGMGLVKLVVGFPVAFVGYQTIFVPLMARFTKTRNSSHTPST